MPFYLIDTNSVVPMPLDLGSALPCTAQTQGEEMLGPPRVYLRELRTCLHDLLWMQLGCLTWRLCLEAHPCRRTLLSLLAASLPGLRGVREGCSGSQGQQLSSRAGVRGRGWCWVGITSSWSMRESGSAIHSREDARQPVSTVGRSRIENERVGGM